jgi:Pirin
MSRRLISRIDTPGPPAPGGIGRGHTAVKVLQPTALESSDPFVLLVDDRFDFEARRRIGGAHPHAGLETVTLILGGTLHDRDVGDLTAGDAIWMSTGRGVIHDEDVEVGGRVRILQLWIALPRRDRALEPRFEIIRRDAAPVVHRRGYRSRALQRVLGVRQLSDAKPSSRHDDRRVDRAERYVRARAPARIQRLLLRARRQCSGRRPPDRSQSSRLDGTFFVPRADDLHRRPGRTSCALRGATPRRTAEATRSVRRRVAVRDHRLQPTLPRR